MQEKIKAATDALSTEELSELTEPRNLTDADLTYVTGGFFKWGGGWGGGCGRRHRWGWGCGRNHRWGWGCGNDNDNDNDWDWDWSSSQDDDTE